LATASASIGSLIAPMSVKPLLPVVMPTSSSL
jgi:hypothetical protein